MSAWWKLSLREMFQPGCGHLQDHDVWLKMGRKEASFFQSPGIGSLFWMATAQSMLLLAEKKKTTLPLVGKVQWCRAESVD